MLVYQRVVPHPQNSICCSYHILPVGFHCQNCISPWSNLDIHMVGHGFYDCQNCVFPLYTVLNLDFRRGQKFNFPRRKMGLSRSSNRFSSSSQIICIYIHMCVCVCLYHQKAPNFPLFPMVKMGMKLGYTLWKTFT